MFLKNVHPHLGKITNLTSIFFRWVDSTTNEFTMVDGFVDPEIQEVID